MYKSLLLLAGAFLYISNSIHAQNVLNGKITDARDGAPLRGVSVYIPDLKTGAATGADGIYRIQFIPAGTYLIEVSAVGYAKQWEKVRVQALETRNYTLTAAGATLDNIVVTGVPAATENQRHRSSSPRRGIAIFWRPRRPMSSMPLPKSQACRL